MSRATGLLPRTPTIPHIALVRFRRTRIERVQGIGQSARICPKSRWVTQYEGGALPPSREKVAGGAGRMRGASEARRLRRTPLTPPTRRESARPPIPSRRSRVRWANAGREIPGRKAKCRARRRPPFVPRSRDLAHRPRRRVGARNKRSRQGSVPMRPVAEILRPRIAGCEPRPKSTTRPERRSLAACARNGARSSGGCPPALGKHKSARDRRKYRKPSRFARPPHPSSPTR